MEVGGLFSRFVSSLGRRRPSVAAVHSLLRWGRACCVTRAALVVELLHHVLVLLRPVVELRTLLAEGLLRRGHEALEALAEAGGARGLGGMRRPAEGGNRNLRVNQKS